MADYAGLGSRIVAIIIDHIILLIVAIILAIPLGFSAVAFSMFADASSLLAPNLALWAGWGVLNFIIWILYFTYFEGTTGQTLGKKAMNIKVTKEDGSQPNYAEALLRTVLRIIDGIAVYILGLIIIVVTEKNQRLGDIVAKTILVKA